jgi:hypothetical protein
MTHHHVEAASAASASAAAYVVAKNAPPIAVVGLSLAGISLQEWLYIITIIWIFYQFFMDVRKRICEKGKEK